MAEVRQERQYDESRKDMWDYYSTMKTARDNGLAEGIEKGMDMANRDNARKMKSDGMSVELIARYTGLSVEEINQIS